MSENLFSRALDCLQTADVDRKLVQVAALRQAWESGEIVSSATTIPAIPIPVPGRPARPEMVSALLVGKRKPSTPEGRAALMHSLAHIEFNAINLALDAVYRFRDLPVDYYADWLRVAAEEAYHFSLLRDHLRTLGFDYGDFTAHNGLWDMAISTAHDPMVRMALVPRVLEARGLDALPMIMHRLASCGAQSSADILTIILRDEIGHVAIGNRWYAYFCELRGLEPIATFRSLLREFNAPKLRGPLHTEARLAAGFSPAEMQMLEDFIG
ncbi:ferritin-like domain-containing protein [Sulfuriferula thiophila]|uniref:ferritin-like domain-containing protein n=1 Tax=Sulfuriferula thiophila TaxID=1781211 RepID=UPI000F609A99|nr:ferritin-like domain-containing protein [Sulfuriferula thiophila]